MRLPKLPLRSVNLILTSDCNLRCSYCYIEHFKDKMSFDMVRQILDWLSSLEGDEKRISLSGGEPFLCFETIVDISHYIDSLEAKYPGQKIILRHIPTNGILLTKKIVDVLKNMKRIKPVFSLDGPSFSSNKLRYKDRKLFRMLLDNINYYVHVTKDWPKINMVVHPTVARDLKKNVTALLGMGFKHIKIIPAHGTTWSKQQALNFIRNYRQLLAIYRYILMNNEKVVIEPLDSYVRRSTPYDYLDVDDCPMGDELMFDPCGDIYTCDMATQFKKPANDEFLLGNINTGIDIKKFEFFKNFKASFYERRRSKTTKFDMEKTCISCRAVTGKKINPARIKNLVLVENVLCGMIDKAIA